jgi:hypothetical protein
MFGRSFSDILSGYRVFSRRFVKSFPVLSGGFEIETELTVHALELELPVGEMATPYYSRPLGSASKLSTWRDGYRILGTALKLYRAERPLSLFGSFGIALAIVSIGLAIPIFVTYVQDGLVPRFPTAILSTGLMLLAFLSIAVGLILDTVTRGPVSSSFLPTWLCARLAKNGGGADDARACAHQRPGADHGDRSVAQRRTDQAPGGRSQHERAGRLDRHFSAPDSGR